MKYITTFLIAVITVFFLSGCDDSNSDTGTLRVALTDAPVHYDAVWIDIREVRVHVESDAEEEDSGWYIINDQPMMVDLLELTNGNYEILGETELEPGRYNQMRFILGEDNEVVIDGQTYPLKTPSAQQSGLKLNIDADIEGGRTHTLLVDFDASQSIVHAGNSGNIILKPVLRAAWLEEAGAIAGEIQPAGLLPWVYAIAGNDTLAGTRALETGHFLMIGLQSGTYQVSVDPATESYDPVIISNVEVSAPDTTYLDEIVLDN